MKFGFDDFLEMLVGLELLLMATLFVFGIGMVGVGLITMNTDVIVAGAAMLVVFYLGV